MSPPVLCNLSAAKLLVITETSPRHLHRTQIHSRRKDNAPCFGRRGSAKQAAALSAALSPSDK